MKKIKKFHYEKLNRGGLRLPDQGAMCKKIEEIIDCINNMNTINKVPNTINNTSNDTNTIKQIVENSLQTIFNEIDKIKNITYSQIKHRHLDNTSDIRDAISDTKLYEYFRNIQIHGKQYDGDKVLNVIKDYIDYEIELLVEKDQWN